MKCISCSHNLYDVVSMLDSTGKPLLNHFIICTVCGHTYVENNNLELESVSEALMNNLSTEWPVIYKAIKILHKQIEERIKLN